MLRLRPIGNGVRCGNFHDAIGSEGLLGVVSREGFDPDELGAGGEGAGGEGYAREESSASDADEEVVERDVFCECGVGGGVGRSVRMVGSKPGQILEEFFADGALSGDDVFVIVGGHEHHFRRIGIRLRQFLLHPLGHRVPLFRISIVKDDVAAVGSRGLDFEGRRIPGHDDGGRDAEEGGGRQGYGLGVIPARVGQYPDVLPVTGSVVVVIAIVVQVVLDGGVGPPELEGAHPLEVFAFEEDADAELGVEGAARVDGGAVGDVLEGLGGVEYVLVGWQVGIGGCAG